MSELIKYQNIIDWCDKMTEEGKRPILKWEGGNDSGWCYMEDEDGERLSNPEAEQIIEHLYDTLDYGSWAGEFNANGEAPYNEETKCFEGTDYYSESQNASFKTEIEISIPIHIKFDSFEIETSEGGHDDPLSLNCDISLQNGFVHPDKDAVMENIRTYLRDVIEKQIDDYIDRTDLNLESCYSHYRFVKGDFKIEGEYQKAILKEIDFSVQETDEKMICLDLNELKENSDEY